MATRTKTVEFAYQTDIATLAAATTRTKTGNTIYLPESGKVFRSVTLVATWGDDASAATSPTNWILGIKLGAAAVSSATVTDTITNSGEAWTGRFRRDVTAYFTTNWTGTSMTWEASMQQAVSATQNHSFRLIITYEYDDTSATHIKTIRIPIESTRTNLTTAYQTIGGATAIPAFKGSYIPEASPVVRQCFIELFGNTNDVTTATDWIATARVNGVTTFDFWDNESALLSGRWAYGIIDITAQAGTSAVSLEAISTGITARLGPLAGVMTVTYEFDPATTTTVFNSVLMGAVDTEGQMGGTISTDEDAWSRSFFIDEPGSITLKESGVVLFMNDNVGFNVNVAIGAQSDTTYTMTTAGVQAGQFSLCHRFDGGGTNGTPGVTLARGENDYSIQFRSTAAGTGWNLSGFMILNYTSSKASAGVGVHAQSRYFHLADTAADQVVRQVNDVTTPIIPESQYYLMSALVDIDAQVTADVAGSMVLGMERTGGLGWQTCYVGTWRADNELMLITPFGAARSQFQRWPGDPDNSRADIETARDWRLDSNPPMWASWGIWATWAAHSYTIAGTVSGYVDADGAGLTVNIHRVSDGELVKSVTTTTGGVFSTTWHDNVEELYCEIYEDATHAGRSANSVAV